MHRSGFVAVVGRPNVGKSSLMNAFLGQKIAIVSPKPQTTRHTQLGILTGPDYQIVFVDTPGMHQPRNKLGEYMVETATRALRDADAVLFIVDVSTRPHPDDERLAEKIKNRPNNTPVLLALNKSDLLRPPDVIPHTDAYRALVPEAQWMLVSATRGDNLEKLRQMLVEVLPEGPALYPEDELTQTHLRDLAAELIREAALNALEQEVPHGIAVTIEDFDESRPDLVRISALLYVERESHKPIVIGKGGAKLKEIGTRARQEIEHLLQQKVFLEIHVKVRKDWRDDERAVRQFGYRKK
ncbi:MAG: GTPase Era [Anaerolineales bacterium]|nr:GTPase Era [Anaerolineales bacterium]